MRPRCSTLTGGFDFSGSGDFTSCPPMDRAEISNSEPSAIVLHAIPCIGGLYISFDSNGENGALQIRRQDSPKRFANNFRRDSPFPDPSRPPSSRGSLSPSPLALPHHFDDVRRWTYL